MREFAPSYRRATIMGVSLALGGLTLGFVVAWQLHDLWIPAGAVFLGGSIPFTLAFILPTNKQLRDPTLDLQSTRVAELLARRNRLHGVQTTLSATALALLLRCLARFHGKAW